MRKLTTLAGIAALCASIDLINRPEGDFEAAWAVEQAELARWAEEEEAERRARERRAEKAKLDLMEQAMRVRARQRRGDRASDGRSGVSPGRTGSD